VNDEDARRRAKALRQACEVHLVLLAVPMATLCLMTLCMGRYCAAFVTEEWRFFLAVALYATLSTALWWFDQRTPERVVKAHLEVIGAWLLAEILVRNGVLPLQLIHE
jgi:hypothetical protein